MSCKIPVSTFELFLLYAVKQSSSSPGPPAPCPHSRTAASTLSPGENNTSLNILNYTSLSLWLTNKVKHSLRASCGRPAAAEVGMESTGWAPQASYTQRGHWPYPSPTPHPPCSSHFLSNHTESYREYKTSFLCFVCQYFHLYISF